MVKTKQTEPLVNSSRDEEEQQEKCYFCGTELTKDETSYCDTCTKKYSKEQHKLVNIDSLHCELFKLRQAIIEIQKESPSKSLKAIEERLDKMVDFYA